MSKTFSNIARAWRTAGTDPSYASDEYGGNRNVSTGYSTLSNGSVTFDPTIRAMRDRASGRLGEGITRYLGDTDTLRGRFGANESSYKDAVLNPLRRDMATRRGELQRSIGLRGLGGSSFGEQSLTNFDTDSGMALRDATAKAEMESVNALSGLDQNRLNAVLGANENELQIAKERLAQELAGLGLGATQIQQQVDMFENSQRRRLMQGQNMAKGSETFHKAVTDWGDFSMFKGGGGGSLGG